MKEIAKNLEKARQELDLNQTEMGKILGVGRDTYNTWVNEKHFPDSENFAKIYGFFKLIERLDMGILDDDFSARTMIDTLEDDIMAEIEKIIDGRVEEKLEKEREKVRND